MATLTPSPGLSPADNYARLVAMAAAIDAGNAARQEGFGNIVDRIGQEFNERVGAMDELEAELGGRLDATNAALDALASFVPATRPGLRPAAFAPGALGASPGGLDPAGCLPDGEGYLVGGTGIVALRAPVWLDADVFWALRLSLERRADVVDPNNAAVDIAIQWLTGSGADAGTTLIRRYAALTRASGVQGLTLRVPSLRGAVPAVTPPSAAVAWRPYVRTYGADGATAVRTMAVTDVTNAGVYAPDVSDLAARMTTLEGLIAGGVPFATPILPSCTVATLPTPGTVGRKIFVADGRAPDAAGTLEPANGGTGVEATDNGARWVITGTNQQVQA